MSIPQGLILYRAPKCLENHPININQGYYSNKILTSPLYINRQRHANFHRRYQKKFIQEISLKVYCDDKVLEPLPKFSSIKKCKFESASESFGREPIKPAAKVFQRIFKVLKRIKRLELPPSGQSEDIAKGFETLLMLNWMESLICWHGRQDITVVGGLKMANCHFCGAFDFVKKWSSVKIGDAEPVFKFRQSQITSSVNSLEMSNEQNKTKPVNN